MSLVKMTLPRGLTNPIACAGPDSDSDPAAEVVVWRLSCARFSLDLHIGGGYNTDCPSCSPGFGSPPDLDVDARSDVVYLAHRPIIGPNAPHYDPVKHASSRSRSRSRSRHAWLAPDAWLELFKIDLACSRGLTGTFWTCHKTRHYIYVWNICLVYLFLMLSDLFGVCCFELFGVCCCSCFKVFGMCTLGSSCCQRLVWRMLP